MQYVSPHSPKLRDVLGLTAVDDDEVGTRGQARRERIDAIW